MKIILKIIPIFALIFLLSSCTINKQLVQQQQDRGLFEVTGASNISYSAPIDKTTVFSKDGEKTVTEKVVMMTKTTTKPDGTVVTEQMPVTVNMFIKDTTPKPIPETPLQTVTNGLLGITKLGLIWKGIDATENVATQPAPQPQVIQVQPTIVRPEIVEVPAS